MFRMEKIRGGSVYGKYLEEHLDYSDYVGEKEKVVGEWFGRGAEELGIQGGCHGAGDERFKNLCDGKHPLTGEQLIRHAKEDGIRFFDFQASAQKSVSIMAVTLGDGRLIDAHNAAVAVGLQELEKFAAYQIGGRDDRSAAITGNVIGARFTHLSARPDSGGGPADPQLHTHCAIANATMVDGEKFYALTEYEMVKAIGYAGKVYQNEMAVAVQKLGYEIEFRHGPKGIEGYEIKGVTKETMDLFSKRSAAVEKAVEDFKAEHGREPTTGELRVIKRETRGEKAHELSKDELVQLQLDQIPGETVDALQKIKSEALARSAAGEIKIETVDPKAGVAEAVTHLYERESVLPEHAIRAEALAQNLGRTSLAEVAAALEKREGLVTLETIRPSTLQPGQKLAELKPSDRANEWQRSGESLGVPIATEDGLKDELRAIKWVRRGKDVHLPFVAEGKYAAFGGQDQVEMKGKVMDVAEQRKAADGILASTDRYLSLRGVAGAGKTTALAEVNKGFKAGGYRPMYLAPTTAARDVLKEEGFRASTVQEFLQEMKNPDLRLPPKSVLVVDEAGLASNKLGVNLMKVAERDGARILFVGDTKQHTSVDAGDFLRILEQNAPVKQFTLGTVRRQNHEVWRAAMQTAAQGDSRAAIEMLDQQGWVHEAKDKYLREAATDYVGKVIEHGREKVLAVAPTHEESRAMTAMIRKDLQAAKAIGEDTNRVAFVDATWTEQQKWNIENYRPGLAVTVTTGKVGELKADQIAIVKTVDVKNRSIVVELAPGREESIRITRNTVGNLAIGEHREIPLAKGDAILITGNHKRNKLTNGDILRVKEIRPDGSIETDEGKIVPGDFTRLTHGYVITSHRSQGETVDHVVIAADKLSPKAGYVAPSRGRESVSIHTAEKEYLFKKLPPKNEGRKAATDYRPAPAEDEPKASHRMRPPAQPNEARRNFWRRVANKANETAKKTKLTIQKVTAYIRQRTRMKANTQTHANKPN